MLPICKHITRCLYGVSLYADIASHYTPVRRLTIRRYGASLYAGMAHHYTPVWRITMRRCGVSLCAGTIAPFVVIAQPLVVIRAKRNNPEIN
ncbi:MAG: hypothetical protein LBK65_07415 [Tannerellaceae bacterium]|nr:hypothetical protein [Tannerellaceae bacterium]